MRPHPAHCRHHNNPASPPLDIPRRQSWPPARPRATLTMVDRSPAARAPGALPGRSRHAAAMARARLLGRPWAQPARVFTTAPAARCAVCLRVSGFSRARLCAHGLSKGQSAPCQPRVAPVQRRAPCARPSGLLPHAGRPHAPGQPSRAGGAALVARACGAHGSRCGEAPPSRVRATARSGVRRIPSQPSRRGPQRPL